MPSFCAFVKGNRNHCKLHGFHECGVEIKCITQGFFQNVESIREWHTPWEVQVRLVGSTQSVKAHFGMVELPISSLGAGLHGAKAVGVHHPSREGIP